MKKWFENKAEELDEYFTLFLFYITFLLYSFYLDCKELDFKLRKWYDELKAKLKKGNKNNEDSNG